MSSGWVAATVRARAMARRRVGPTLAHRVASAPTLDDGVALLAGTALDHVAGAGTPLRDVEHGIRGEQLWELRVLAGWMPAAGTPLARALAARFELANIEQHRARLAGREDGEQFRLGTLATSWPRLARTSSLDELRGALRASPWGDPGDMTATGLHDALLVAWLRMVGATSTGLPAVGRWVAGGAALLLARTVIVLGQTPPEHLVRAAAPLVGGRWTGARSAGELRAALPSRARWALAGVEQPRQLWRAEARLRARVETDGFGMLRSPRAGPAPVVGALALLAVDRWRVRAGLACAEAGTGPGEVLHAVA